MAGDARHDVERARRGFAREALPFFACSPSKTEGTGGAQREPEHGSKMRLVPVPANTDAHCVFGAEHLADPGRCAAECLDTCHGIRKPGWDGVGLLQSPLGVVVSEAEGGDASLTLEGAELKGLQGKLAEAAD